MCLVLIFVQDLFLEHTLFCAWKFLIWVFTFSSQPCIFKFHLCLLLPPGPLSSVSTERHLPFPWHPSAPSVSTRLSSHPLLVPSETCVK